MQATSEGIAETWATASAWIVIKHTLFDAIILEKTIHWASDTVLLGWVLKCSYNQVKNITSHSSFWAYWVELWKLDTLNAIDVLQTIQFSSWYWISEQAFYFTASLFSAIAILWPFCCRNRIILACLNNLIIFLIVLFHSFFVFWQRLCIFFCWRLFSLFFSFLRVSTLFTCRSWSARTIRLNTWSPAIDFLFFNSFLKIYLASHCHGQSRRMLENIDQLFDMSSCCLVVVLIRLHEYPWVCLQIKLGQLCIIV